MWLATWHPCSHWEAKSMPQINKEKHKSSHSIVTCGIRIGIIYLTLFLLLSIIQWRLSTSSSYLFIYLFLLFFSSFLLPCIPHSSCPQKVLIFISFSHTKHYFLVLKRFQLKFYIILHQGNVKGVGIQPKLSVMVQAWGELF